MISCYILHSQSLNVWNLQTYQYPLLTASFYALDSYGKQIIDLDTTMIEVRENYIKRKILDISCPATTPVNVSSVLTIDISNSMDSSRLKAAQAAANKWVQMLDLGTNECALTSFGDRSYLNQDFTTDEVPLTNAIGSLKVKGGTNYDEAFLNPYSGAISVAKKGKHSRVIVFLSDGQSNREPHTDSIIALARAYDIKVYCIAVAMRAPDYLKRIAEETGGKYIEYVKTANETIDSYTSILFDSRGIVPCTISWLSTGVCTSTDYDVVIRFNPSGSPFVEKQYTTPPNTVAKLDISPSSIVLANYQPNVPCDTVITLKAINSDFDLYDMQSSNPIFELIPDHIYLEKDSTAKVILRFTPLDSNFQKTTLTFKNNLCDQELFARTIIRPRNGQHMNYLKLTHPNGGEYFVFGSDTAITWQGVLPSDTIKLEYSFNNGATWNLIAKKAWGLSYNWHNIPRPASSECLVRASMKNNDINLDTTLDKPILLDNHTDTVRKLLFSPDLRYVVSGSKETILWDPLNFNIIDKFDFRSDRLLFSPDVRYLYSADKDVFRITDLNNFTTDLDSNFNKMPMTINHAGKLIACVANNDSIVIWNIQTKSSVKIGAAESGIIDMQFSNNDKYLLVALDNNTIQLWSTVTWMWISNISYGGHSYYVNSIAFSPDDKFIAVGGYDGKVRLWETQTGILAQTFSGNTTKSLNVVCFSADGALLAAAGFEKKIALWEVETGDLLHTYSGHEGEIETLSFSPLGQQLVTGSADKKLGIWNFGYLLEILDSDQSDSLFTIVVPECIVDDIDLGTCIVNTPKDSLVTDFIKNIGSYPARVDSIVFKDNSGVFSLRGNFPPYTVNNNNVAPGEFEFVPTYIGNFSDSIIIYTQSDVLKCKIQGIGIDSKIKILNNVVDFGLVRVGETKDTNDIFTIQNIGTAPITIDSTIHSYPNSVDFSTTLGKGPFTLLPSESHQMNLQFTPSAKGKTEGTLLFYYNGGGSPATVELYGEGYTTPPVIEAELDSFPDIFCHGVAYSKLKIRNTGWNDLIVNSIEFTGQNGSDFSIPGFTGLQLKRDSSAIFVLQCNPASFGTEYATLEINSNGDPDSLLKFDVSCTKVEISYRPVTEEIDLGTLCTGEIKDTNFLLQNTCLYPIGAYFGSSPNLKINLLGIQIPVQDSASVPFRFTGLFTEGVINEEIKVADSLCDIRQVIKVVGKIANPKVEANDVQIITKINEAGTGLLVLKNIGEREITISELPEIQLPFSFLDNPFPKNISPGDSVVMSISYISTDTLEHEALILFTGDPCNLSFEVKLEGKAYTTLASGNLQAGNAESYAGELVEISIMLTDTSEFNHSGIKSIDLEVSYNPTLLEPVNYTGEILDDHSAKIKLSGLPIQSPELEKIIFIAGLGNAEACSLNISNVVTNGGWAQLHIKNGEYTLLGVCPEGGARLINPNETSTMVVGPNPNNGIIAITLKIIEKGECKLEIVDLEGRIRKTIFDNNPDTNGSRTFIADVSDLSPGVYLLIFNSPTIRIGKKLEIVK